MIATTKSILVIFSLLISFLTPTFAQYPTNTQWFENVRYDMFIHWGVYSAADRLWKGEKLL